MFVSVLKVILGLVSLIVHASCKDWHYYISADEVEWNYFPYNENKVSNDSSFASEFLENRDDRIGSTYTKLLYREYTDNTFSILKPAPAWAGFCGPLIKSTVGDTVYIHFKNNATLINRRISMHPHGLFYFKGNEGALYIDGTSGSDTVDNAIAPGQTFTYVWIASKLHKPDTSSFHDHCAAFTYHSHVRAAPDVDTGLFGVALICNKGTLDGNGNRKDVDRELFLYADLLKEGNSWYIEHNLNKCGNTTLCTNLHNEGDDDFAKSNEMSHINGYMYGNGPAFPACEGETVAWYFMSIQRGIHTIHISGQTMEIEHIRTDTVDLHPASVYSGFMKPINVGRWLIYTRNQEFYDDGMQAFLDIESCQDQSNNGQNNGKGTGKNKQIRTYYLAIENVFWDYASDDVNHPGSDIFLQNDTERIGREYKKALFFAYTDDTFTTKVSRETHWGLAGPPIKAKADDHVIVHVKNLADRTYSFQANGVSMSKLNEGMLYLNEQSVLSGLVVPPNGVETYEFDVPAEAAPLSHNEDCITYMYHSAVDFNKDIHTGLIGPLLVCKDRTLADDGSLIGVDKEFYLHWMVFDENLSWYIDDNINEYTTGTVDKDDEDFQLSNQIRAINGKTYGTLEGLDMHLGDTVAWSIYGSGGQTDHHHVVFEGNAFNVDGRNLDTFSVYPGTGQSFIMNPDQVGRLMIRDGQISLTYEGQYAWYNVLWSNGIGYKSLEDETPQGLLGINRTYYIGIVPILWDYCPVKIDPIDGTSLYDEDSSGLIFVRNDSFFLGTEYKKIVYREFTDDSFSVQKSRSFDERHLGLLGPMVRGAVGDTIKIVLRNFANVSLNIVPKHLVFLDGSPITDAPPTAPLQTRTYNYFIPERSGPSPDQPNCIGTLYSSRTNPLKDAYSGLLGPMIICKRGKLDDAGKRTDKVDKEFASGFVIWDENLSHLRDENFGGISNAIANDGDFIESNLMHSINGYIYGNQPPIQFSVNQYVVWYLFGVGSVEDVHTVHFHGQLYVRKTKVTQRRDVAEVFPEVSETVEMLGYNPGIWLYHCHLAEHAEEGMESSYQVLPTERRRRRRSSSSDGIRHTRKRERDRFAVTD